MPFVQGKLREDFAGIQYEDDEASVPDLTFPPVETQDSNSVPDMTFPTVGSTGSGITDFEFPSTDMGTVQQPVVDENKSVGVLSHIRGWFR